MKNKLRVVTILLIIASLVMTGYVSCSRLKDQAIEIEITDLEPVLEVSELDTESREYFIEQGDMYLNKATKAGWTEKRQAQATTAIAYYLRAMLMEKP